MPPIIPTPYDDRIAALRDRMGRRPSDKQRSRLQRLQGRQYFHAQANRPPTPDFYSGQYESTVGRLNRDRDQAFADIEGRRLGVEQQFGFGVDTSNPFSQARMIDAQARQRREGTLNSYAARGHLYSGALSRQRAADAFTEQQQLDQSLRGYQGELSELARGELQTQREYDEGLATAEAERLQAALEERVDPSEAPPRPPGAKRIMRNIGRRARRAKGARAQALRERLSRLQDLPYG